jgi:hypothetical protein
MNVKDKMKRRIDLKASRMEKLKVELTQRSANTEAYILRMLEELDHQVMSFKTEQVDIGIFRALCVESVQQRIRLIDAGANVDISWADETQTQVNGILVKWSKEYQVASSCEPELYVDATAALFKE